MLSTLSVVFYFVFVFDLQKHFFLTNFLNMNIRIAVLLASLVFTFSKLGKCPTTSNAQTKVLVKKVSID